MTTGEVPATPRDTWRMKMRARARTRTRDGRRREGGPSNGGAVYGLGMVGALVYFVGTAASQRDYLLSLPKAMVWPALLVYRSFKQFGG